MHIIAMIIDAFTVSHKQDKVADLCLQVHLIPSNSANVKLVKPTSRQTDCAQEVEL